MDPRAQDMATDATSFETLHAGTHIDVSGSFIVLWLYAWDMPSSVTHTL